MTLTYFYSITYLDVCDSKKVHHFFKTDKSFFFSPKVPNESNGDDPNANTPCLNTMMTE